MTIDEIEELSIPTYRLEEVGLARTAFSEVVNEIRVNGVEVTQSWSRGEKRLTSVPKEIKEQYPDELSEITQSVKDIRKMLPAQRDRIENRYLAQKSWKLPVWRERYLDHPLVGTIARRLIWISRAATRRHREFGQKVVSWGVMMHRSIGSMLIQP